MCMTTYDWKNYTLPYYIALTVLLLVILSSSVSII